MKPAFSVQALEEQVDAAVASVRAKTAFVPKVGAVLGSGLGYLAQEIEAEVSIPYSEIDSFPMPSVEGHHGELVMGTLGGAPVAFLSGRIHLYEGFSAQEVVFPVRVLRSLGAEILIVTNAAGGINADYGPGDLMLLDDHINLTGRNPLIGPNVKAWGPRFPDMGGAYDADLKEIAQACAKRLGVNLHKGVYVGLTGPSYETPAEIRMLRRMGGDAVGMSTVLEIIAARHMGFRSLAISCIANLAADLHQGELSHEEVTHEVGKTKEGFGKLIKALIKDATS